MTNSEIQRRSVRMLLTVSCVSSSTLYDVTVSGEGQKIMITTLQKGKNDARGVLRNSVMGETLEMRKPFAELSQAQSAKGFAGS